MLSRDQRNQNSLNLFLNNYFSLILTTGILLLLLLAYLAVILPKYQEVASLTQDNLNRQQLLLTEQRRKLVNLQAISQAYDLLPELDVNKFNQVLPDQYVKERLFGELEEIVTKNGFITNSISLSQEPPEAGSPTKIGTVTAELNISTIDYSGFKRMLRVLESNLRLLDVTNLSFSPGGNTANLSLTTYYFAN
ncbi:MAG: hypothetical protein ACOX0C_01580 [Patescibacteria group bacterium]|jgi:hypothetical protein